MGRLHHERATDQHIEELIPQLREGDHAELVASSGCPWQGCYSALLVSADPSAMRDRYGGLVALYGCAPVTLLGRRGAPWLLGTNRMRDAAFSVFYDMRLYIGFLREHYDELFNYVDARNVESIGWLQRLGFQIGEPEAQGPFKLAFRPFYMDMVNAV